MLRNIVALTALIAIYFSTNAQSSVFVASNGNDNNSGSIQKPFKTISAALLFCNAKANADVIIEIRGGVYYLDSTILIRNGSYKSRSLTIRAFKNEKVIISGAKPYHLEWQLYKNGIFKAPLYLIEPADRLFCNGIILPMARYPNYDSTARVFNGTAADAINNEKVKRWHNPAGAYVHALHNGEWGGLHYKIIGKDANGKLILEGGWQNNRPSPMNAKYRFVENLFEELDTPGEWYYDAAAKMLYVFPSTGVDICKATIAIGHLKELIVLKGDARQPVKNISIKNIFFEQTDRTFMLTKEPLLRSDWTIYRGGAVLFDGTEHCSIYNCTFTEIGGNAIFLSNYNKDDLVKDNHIYNVGASAIAFVGNPAAVRSPSFSYDAFVEWNKMDYTVGPLTNDYPQYCKAEGNLIHSPGTIEKQSAGVEIDMASHITVSHNSIYKTPRAGINIGDGCWGGHILEYNDVFNTVRETGDHGAFNSWGRDRFWRSDRNIIDSIIAAKPGIELLDVVDPNIIRNNRFQCDHGWDIDLDDGSSNYQIYNNICLSGGLKLREGYHRAVYNNIIVNNTFHPHVWLKNSDDVFAHNIVTAPYAPIQIDQWGKQVDSNFFLSSDALKEAKSYGVDRNSLWGDAMFVHATSGDYELQKGSPALRMGLTNFNMNTGVELPALKRIAEKPPVRPLMAESVKGRSAVIEWLGAKLKNVETPGERSAAGLPDEKGALITIVPVNSAAHKNGLQKGDVIVKIKDNVVLSAIDLLQKFEKVKWMGVIEITIMRNQSLQTININVKE
ncbi:MAG: right-handed parallel beta-helix repeat-containing protein [Bacteroidota bacterium]